MRIRKNVKLSSVMPTEMLQTHVCQLNQSPWDVISFSQEPETSSLNHRLEKKDIFTEDERLGDKIGDVNESATSLIEREKKVESNIEDNNANNQSVLKREERILCCTKNGELKQLHNTRINAPTNGLIKNPEITATTARRGRPRATKTGSTSIFNQCTEFYYYSGFGPFRGKKRGEIGDEGTEYLRRCNQNNKPFFSQIDSVALAYTVDDEVREDDKNGDIDKTEDEYAEDEDDKNDKKKRRKSVKARSLQSLM